MRATLWCLLLTVFIVGPSLAQAGVGNAPLVIRGHIITMDPNHPVASAMVVRRGIVESIGEDDILTICEADAATQVLQLAPGQVVFPGIIDSHAHFRGVGQAARILDLSGARSAEEVGQRVAAAAAGVSSETWILGRGWNQEAWEVKAFPDASILDHAAPQHPVALTRVDGHALWVNSRALHRAQIGPDGPSVQGGEIIRGPDGRATGILVDRAMDLVSGLVPTDGDTRDSDYRAAQAAALSLGITTFVDAGVDLEDLLALNRLYADQTLKIRLYAMVGVDNDAALEVTTAGRPIQSAHGDRVTVRAIKLYADGALGSRGAWMHESYADRDHHHGLSVLDPAFLERAARRGLATGWQICVHAIGDRATTETLNAFERALKSHSGPIPDHRFRIEHAQIVDRSDFRRFAKLGVIPSMQACHALSDGPWVRDRIGIARTLEGAYAWRSLLDAGSYIPNGTDAPVEPLSPWRNLEASVSRLLLDPGQDGSPFHPGERMNRYEALQSLTVWGAKASFSEQTRGNLRPGKVADFIVLDRDPMHASVFDLRGTLVLSTYIGGELVYSRGG